MAPKILYLLIVSSVVYLVSSESDVISQPIPGQEYVFVHTSNPGARPISRKEKSTDASDRPFETAHKLPAILTFKQEPDSEEVVEKDITKGKYSGKILKYQNKEGSKQKREAKDAVPAPAGSIKLDPKKLIERYRSEIEASKTTSKPTKAPARQSTTGRPTRRSRTKKEAPTTPSTVLTTGAPPTPRTLLLNSAEGAKEKEDKVASGTENKRSRIQIKKGPNGQEYEYEYVYYYYDEDVDEKKDGAAGKTKVSNAHDGPARGSATRTRSSTTAHPEPAANEVVPSGRGTRQRGRQLTHEVPEEKVAEERLPLNTRFPPRSRNINTTPSTPEEEESKNKNRQRGKPQGQPADSQVDETQVSGRGRNRPNVRRPSLELVDSASFNTHSSNDPAIEPYKEPKARGEQVKNSQGPSFPSELPEGPVRFLGATPNERTELQDTKTKAVDTDEVSTKADSDAAPTTEEAATTEMSAMDKVALDLYAILQGTQKLSGEDKEEFNTEDSTTTDQTSTDETTTELLTTEELTTPSTTTTTTTTEAPTTTTTTTPEPVTGRGRFRGRPGTSANRFKSSGGATTTTTAPAPETSTEKGKRFGRPFGARPRPVGSRVTTEAGEPEATKEDSKPVSNAKSPIGSRTRFSARGRPSSTTAAPESSDSTTASSSRSSFTRPRPGAFNLRRRGGTTTTTKEPADGETPANEGGAQEEASTTAKPIRSRVSGNLSPRPLRPGPRLNLAARGRPGAPTSTTASPEGGADHENAAEEIQQEGEEKNEDSTLPPGGNTLTKLRNRPKLTVTAAKQKPAATAQVQVRRTNPLLARRKPVQNVEPSEAPTEASPEAGATDAPEEEAPSEAPSSTTEEPRGLNKLLAGRRRLVRPPAPTH